MAPPKEYMDILKQAYRKGTLVPFVGAGLSAPLDVPGWGVLIDDLWGRFSYKGLIDNKEKITGLIEANYYLDAVEEIKRAGVKRLIYKARSVVPYKGKKKNNQEIYQTTSIRTWPI